MNSELIAYYVNLLIIQYANKPKARTFIEKTITALMVYDIAIKVRDGFDLETAVGAQLDILGKYIGNDRIVTGTTFDRAYFGYSEYGETTPFDFNGYIGYGEVSPDVQFRSYTESRQSLYSLNDEEFRQILKFRIIKNTGIASTKSIDDFVAQYFGTEALFNDRMDMTISYIFQEELRKLVTIAYSENLLPKPAAVGISVSFVGDISHIFSYSSYGDAAPSFAVGYSSYDDTDIIGGWASYGETL